MLMLARQIDETLMIGKEITVTVPSEAVHREEMHDRAQREKTKTNSGIAPARKVWLLGGAMALLALTGSASAESLSERVRACASESDSLRRLVCYDKNVAPFAETAPVGEPKRDAAASPVQQDSKPSAVADAAVQYRSSQKELRHITAHVVAIGNEHGQMLVHLDNGQVWEQVQDPTADMNLRVGDSVTIDKRNLLGSYWLGGRTEGVMKVRLKE
jgi:sRNA-binding carbon storage regulator CsrA